ncbi:alpha-N-arabinofuranosidase [Dysgonomonas capnocytophagoides]|uniref:non-reducing end alpha-L-arabinofuranosidase n=1 Tax=Dysgonomonas capnocytophagoides TaxID=45254 RepID=A0A4Y8L9Z6_9BACT|nr:alpha-L-arabinofuranosidase C-terminal domain-containing protein [Dysgonomonas capnocytophagoides]TFD97316.1 alpha-N-arabinofuranosidase [Dysgonomonas capnocytophagoides]
MKKILTTVYAILLVTFSASSQNSDVSIRVYPEKGNQVISKHIYGHFAEHLGSCIYGGLWVGENSPIPNTKGYRTDVLEALKKLQIPNLRWPGGCFADEYHWMDGIGPREKRPKMVNNNWGGTVEDNSFGTHEFLNLCELLDCEPYISGNVGSGTVEELAKWVEYMTSDGDSPMANLRRQNGREKPWKVKYLGVGNESWGCGGDMLPEYYADLYRRYAVYCRNFDGNQLFKIGSGASDYDYNWTDVLMKKAGNKMNGLSLHYYTVKGWGKDQKGSATNFTDEDYYWTLGKSLEIEEVIQKHMSIMDKYDKDKKVGLMVDEWGTWFEVEPGTNPGFLYQQNTMRDAFVAALTLNTFNKYGDRIQMANIAQVVNVLQSMILTKDDKMTLTPTYHVFDMYRVHQDATYLPLDIISQTKEIRGRNVSLVNASASKKDGLTHITLANIDLTNSQNVNIDLSNTKISKVSGRILTSKDIHDHNTFENPNLVQPQTFNGAKIANGKLNVQLPAKSIVVLEIQ